MTTIYQRVEDGTLHQGDVVLGLQIPVVVGESFAPGARGPGKIEVDLVETNVVLVSQTCDLVHRKIDSVIVAPINDWERLEATGSVDGTAKDIARKRKSIARGYETHLALLHPNRPHFGWCVADFRQLRLVPASYLQQVVPGARDCHFRMASPYREAIAQSLAKFVMRVAIPGDLSEFENAGWAKG